MRDRAARGRSWKLLACAGISVASPLALARHRVASLGTSRHPEGTSRRHGAAMAGEVYGDASDRWGGATSRASLLPTRRAVTRNGPHGGRTGAKRPLSMGNSQQGLRRSALGMRCSVLRLSGGAGAGGRLTPHTTHHNSDTRTPVWSRLGGWKLGGYRDIAGGYPHMDPAPPAFSGENISRQVADGCPLYKQLRGSEIPSLSNSSDIPT